MPPNLPRHHPRARRWAAGRASCRTRCLRASVRHWRRRRHAHDGPI